MDYKDPFAFERLIDWIEGRLSAEEAETLARQIETADETTRADLTWLRTFYLVSQNLILKTPSSVVQQQLRQQFAAFVKKQRQLDWKRLVASLTFDSRSQPALVGVRAGAMPDQTWQLIYSTEAAEIALNVWPGVQADQVDLAGQIFPLQDSLAEPFVVQLLRDVEEIRITATDSLGEFVFKSIPKAMYEVVLSGGQREIILPTLDLQV